MVNCLSLLQCPTFNEDPTRVACGVRHLSHFSPESDSCGLWLQLKTWTEGEGMSGRAHTGSTSDVKAHVLSYLVWIYGLSDQPAAEMGKWPPYLSAHCAYGRGARKGARKGGDDDDLVRLDEFLCVPTPFSLARTPRTLILCRSRCDYWVAASTGINGRVIFHAGVSTQCTTSRRKSKQGFSGE